MTSPQKYTEAGLARFLSAPGSPVSRQYVHELVKKGVLKKDADGLIDLQEAKQALLNRVHPGGKTTQNLIPDAATDSTPAATETTFPPLEPEADAEITSFHIAKTLREAAEAQMARLKLAEMQGKVIQTDAVRAAWSRRVAGTRDALLQIPSRLAPVLAAEPSMERIALLLETELRQALHELSRDGAANTVQPAAEA